MWVDPTCWIQIVIAFFSLYGFVLFVWNWTTMGRARPFFIYVTLMLGGVFLLMVGNLIRLYAFWTDREGFLSIGYRDWWDWRLILLGLAVVATTLHMQIRIIRAGKEGKRD